MVAHLPVTEKVAGSTPVVLVLQKVEDIKETFWVENKGVNSDLIDTEF